MQPVSMVGMYGIETIFGCMVLVPEFRRTGDSTAEPPPWRAMFRMGMQWQVSSWADFATFQLPRILAAVGGTSRSVLSRFGAPVWPGHYDSAVRLYPIVLPAAATVWVREGMTGVTRLVQRYLSGTTDVFFLVGAALIIPLAAPAIEVWAGISLTKSGQEDGTARPPEPRSGQRMTVALGMVVYASTGMFSAVLLAVDDLGDIMRYKTAQLLLAAVLLSAAETYSLATPRSRERLPCTCRAG